MRHQVFEHSQLTQALEVPLRLDARWQPV